MKLIIQRVSSAAVVRKKDGKVFGQIKDGLFVLLGIKKGDSKTQANFLVDKLLKLRILPDSRDLMNLSLVDKKADVLVVSQFTLYADTKGGRRPSFVQAETPKKAKILYQYFIDLLKENGVNVKTGSFGDYMEINVKLDGPVTIIYEKDN